MYAIENFENENCCIHKPVYILLRFGLHIFILKSSQKINWLQIWMYYTIVWEFYYVSILREIKRRGVFTACKLWSEIIVQVMCHLNIFIKVMKPFIFFHVLFCLCYKMSDHEQVTILKLKKTYRSTEIL